MRVVVCGLFLWLSAAVCSAAGPFDGKWIVHLTGPAPAVPQTLRLAFKSDADKVSGSMTIDAGPELPIEWGMAKGDLLTFYVKQPFQGGTQQLFVYLGKLEGDQISFGRRPVDLSLGRLREFTAMKDK